MKPRNSASSVGPLAQSIASETRSATTALSTILANLAFHDWALLGFHLYILARAVAAPDSAESGYAREVETVLLSITASTILFVRAELLPPGLVRSVFYRLGVFAPAVLTYFLMRTLMPALHLNLLDDQLHAIDRGLFGVTPSVWMAQFNTPTVTEWFAFFYWSYFTIMGCMLLPELFFGRGRRLIELLTGAMIVTCVGHIGYTLVPGLGPYATLSFAEPLHGGLFWGLVQETVNGAGAMMDIFPSLHTAFPTFYALHAFAHRDFRPYKFAWPVLAFFAVNIIIATMFLRWHWGIDVVFGLLLAVTARAVASWTGPREAERGDGNDKQEIWEPVFAFQRKAQEAKRRAVAAE